MKKKILSLLLALVMVFGVFIPVSTIDASAAGAIYSVLDDVKTYQVDTYDELKTALTANETQRVIVLTGDIIVENSTQNISITPNLDSKKIVLDLNGYDIFMGSSAYLFRSIFTIDQAGWFHIINTKFDGTNNYSELSIKSDYGSVLLIKNEQAEVSVMSGINLKSDNVGLNISACHRLYMYGVDITTDYTGIFFTEKEKDIFAQAWFSFNDVVVTSGNNCVDLRGIPELDDYSIDIDFNHVILKSSTAAIISKQTQLTPKDFKQEKSSDPVYTYNNGHSTEPIFYATTLEDLRTDRDIAYYNNPFMGNGTSCAHSNKSDFLVTTRGHIVRCNDCFAYTKYTSHTGTMTAMPPSSYGLGYTDGINCSCGFKTYNTIPVVKPPKLFENIIEVSSFDELKLKAEDSSLSNVTLVLKKDIVVSDDTKSYTITPKVKEELRIDLNGHNLTVNSDATKYLFDLSYAMPGSYGTELVITNTNVATLPTLLFNSSMKNNAAINLDNKANSLFIANVKLQNGKTNDKNVDATTVTYNISAKSFYNLTINTATLINYKNNSSNILFDPATTVTFAKSTVKIDDVNFECTAYNFDFDGRFSDTYFKKFDLGTSKYVSGNHNAPFMFDYNATAKLGTFIKDTFYISGENGKALDLESVVTKSDLFDKKTEYTVEYGGMFACKHPQTEILMYTKDFHIRICSVCNKVTLEEHTKKDAQPAADCTLTGKSEYIDCSLPCGYKTTATDVPGEHKMVKYEKSDATCTKDGWKETFEVCETCYLYAVKEDGTVLTGDEAAEFYLNAGIPKKEHNYKFIEKHNATCTSSGAQSDYWICTVCNNYFVTDAKTPISLHEFSKNIYLPKLSHKLTAVGANPATCTTDGNIAHFKCTRENCGMLFSDSEGKNEITTVKVPATGHNLQKVAAVKPTCTKNGNIEHYKCSTCSKLFSDSAAKNEITDTTAKATGHSYEWVVTKPAQVGVEGEKANKCKTCGDVKETQKIPALEPQYILGDVDGDKFVKASDARLALRASVGLETLNATQKKAADADKNGEIKAADARLILRASVGLETLK